ncbi:MAG: hypothetical protein JW863_12740 [Chitinispirillaceae bacterium]|nr:hypothetical protein [Chitinispirillaceae bacterium]
MQTGTPLNTTIVPRLKPLFNGFLVIIFIAGTATAIRYLGTVIRDTSWQAIGSAISAITPLRFSVAMLYAATNYLVITGYDFFGLRFAGSKRSWRSIAPIAFMGDAINASTPFSSIVGSVIKLRLYTKSFVRYNRCR